MPDAGRSAGPTAAPTWNSGPAGSTTGSTAGSTTGSTGGGGSVGSTGSAGSTDAPSSAARSAAGIHPASPISMDRCRLMVNITAARMASTSLSPSEDRGISRRSAIPSRATTIPGSSPSRSQHVHIPGARSASSAESCPGGHSNTATSKESPRQTACPTASIRAAWSSSGTNHRTSPAWATEGSHSNSARVHVWSREPMGPGYWRARGRGKWPPLQFHDRAGLSSMR